MCLLLLLLAGAVHKFIVECVWVCVCVCVLCWIHILGCRDSEVAALSAAEMPNDPRTRKWIYHTLLWKSSRPVSLDLDTHNAQHYIYYCVHDLHIRIPPKSRVHSDNNCGDYFDAGVSHCV